MGRIFDENSALTLAESFSGFKKITCFQMGIASV